METAAPRDADFKLRSILVPLLAIIAGVFMVVLDSTAMNVALPTLVKDFSTSLTTLQWVVTGYMLAQASVIPLSGWLSDRFGAKKVFLTAIVLFTIGSILCATPSSAEWLIVFRVIQGLGGGCVLPVSMAYVYRLSPMNKVGVVMGIMGVPVLFAPAIGPVLSGWLVEYHSWRWIFLINIPVGIICVLIGWFKLPRVEPGKAAGFDKFGILLGPLAFAALSYGVSQGSESWTSDKTLIGLGVGILALVAFVINELRVETPLLELRIFRSVDFSAGIIVQWVGQFGLYGALFLLPQFLQQARGFGAFDTGLTLLPQAIASGLMMPIAGFLFDRIGVRWLVVAGLSLVSGALYQYSFLDLNTQSRDIILPLVMCGLGMGMMTMPMNTHLINKAPQNLVSRVTSLTNSMQQVVNSLAISTLVTILTAKTTVRADELRAAAAQQGANAASASPASAEQAMHAAVAGGFTDTFHIMAFVALGGAVLGLVLRRGRKAGPDGPGVEPGRKSANR
ncbi:DHA2 family efflux MFS transporter permease subunit [Saccharibacillus sp. CPCC 101409]|uniref:DHA2 family efflux MFS transporter permease subunit n=1 Tax=Saccharibacillus sp. CPCC 101409 TaxID=3058041 RepID=UPI0026721A63|nr:DHA2 family efflux MFS transporter permease subunit [Saccharibacillus sp. CPCC 101409]MDO3410219.1 DHA2 family efflux MFS transporter permease subunit [Saccharibacillus sp. CPCC 101409]